MKDTIMYIVEKIRRAKAKGKKSIKLPIDCVLYLITNIVDNQADNVLRRIDEVEREIISDIDFGALIKDFVDEIIVYNDRAVKVTFKDGTYEKAVCQKGDIFNKETGVYVCILKKLFGKKSYYKFAKGMYKKMPTEMVEEKTEEKTEEKAETYDDFINSVSKKNIESKEGMEYER